MEDVLALIEARNRMKAESDYLDEQRKAMDAQIEVALGQGLHHVGAWSITVQDTTEDRFDSTRFRKDNPEMAAAYTKSASKHIFKIVAIKAGAAA